MKRTLTLVLALLLVLALAGCGAQKQATAAATDPLKPELSSEILAEDATVNPDGKTINILVVVDMQKDFVDGALGTGEAQAIVPAVVAKIEEYKAAGGTIIVTQDTHESNDLDTQEGKNLPVVHCVKDTDGWLVNSEVSAALPKDAIYIAKPTFGSTELIEKIGEYVKKYGQEYVNVELVGLCTDICVVSNALCLKAFYYEMPISLDAACCAGVTPESHQAALTTMTMCQIHITNNG